LGETVWISISSGKGLTGLMRIKQENKGNNTTYLAMKEVQKEQNEEHARQVQ